MSAPDDRPWTVEEAADYLQKDPETIRRWARSGKLIGKKIDKHEWRFSPEAVRARLQPVALVGPAAVVEAQMNASFARVMQQRRGTA